MREQQEQMLEAIQQDIANFCNPGTEVQVSARGAIWEQGRKKMEVVFTRGNEEYPRIRYNEKDYGYKSFFASEHMADLSALAESIANSRMWPETPNYVENLATLEEDDQPTSATELLGKLSTQDLPFGATRVLFVRGQAGAGKTASLRQLTIDQAQRVVSGSSSVLFFYIDAQARALARLDEAVALILQDLRSIFTYRALGTLTRLGLVVPIIDGFDELLGAGGYGDAFDSLAKFLARLGGMGSLIASARSTFYEYHDFRESAVRYERSGHLNFEILPVDICPWDETQLKRYLEIAGAMGHLAVSSPEDALTKLRDNLGDDGAQFLKTPFFVAALVKLLGEGQEVVDGSRATTQIIKYFVLREKDKLRDKHDKQIVDEDGHFRFLEMLAEEMWWQEMRELDVETVKVIAELAADEIGLQAGNRLTFVERAPTYAFFEARQQEGRSFLGFTHEYYYSFFLGQFIARQILETDSELGQLLARARMSHLVGEEFGHAVNDGQYSPKIGVSRLSQRKIPSLTRELNRTNAGTLFSGLLHVVASELSGENFSNADFFSVDFSETSLKGMTFTGCNFLHCDFMGAEWSDVNFLNCVMTQPVVDRHSTNLGDLAFEVGEDLLGIVDGAGNAQSVIYDPVEMLELARAAGLVKEEHQTGIRELSDGAKKHILLLKKFLRAAGRSFYLSDDDLEIRGISSNPQWQTLEKLLLDSELMEFVVIQRRGPANRVRKLTILPTDLQEGETGNSREPKISLFWEKIKAL